MRVSGESDTQVIGVQCLIILGENPEGKRPPETHRCGLEVNIEM
jgi:hypothetical protein